MNKTMKETFGLYKAAVAVVCWRCRVDEGYELVPLLKKSRAAGNRMEDNKIFSVPRLNSPGPAEKMRGKLRDSPDPSGRGSYNILQNSADKRRNMTRI